MLWSLPQSATIESTLVLVVSILGIKAVTAVRQFA